MGVRYKIGKGNLTQVGSSIQYLLDELQSQNVEILPITIPHILRLEYLPPIHKDPFDRLIIAQALEENLALLTSDHIFASYGVTLAAQ